MSPRSSSACPDPSAADGESRTPRYSQAISVDLFARREGALRAVAEAGEEILPRFTLLADAHERAVFFAVHSDLPREGPGDRAAQPALADRDRVDPSPGDPRRNAAARRFNFR